MKNLVMVTQEDGDLSEPGDPDDNPPDDEGPDDPHENPDSSKHGIQNNLADTIAAIGQKTLQRQGDGPCSKVQENLIPSTETDLAKLRTFLVTYSAHR